MYEQRHEIMRDHEIDFITSMYKKIVYSGREPEGHEEQTIKKMYRIYLSRKL
jgi:hypothetical protein